MAAITIIMEFLQTALFIMDPVFGWDIEWDECAYKRLNPRPP